MIEGLDLLLTEQEQLGISALEERVSRLICEQYPGAHLIRHEKIKTHVYRIHFRRENEHLSLILKNMEGRIARRNERVAQRWLPAVGLTEAGPPLLTAVGTPDAQSVWHIYRDLGANSLAEEMDNAQKISATLRTIADVHQRFIDHPYRPEFRLFGGDLGAHFVKSNVMDAILTLEKIKKSQEHRESQEVVVDRLLGYVSSLMEELPSRMRILKELSGPETLLHGDLWPSNIFVSPEGGVRLIDWDRAAAGPIAYDLSTFILRFPRKRRTDLMELYRQMAHSNGWEVPAYKDLNIIFETFELARYACQLIWPAIALWEEGADWAHEQLEEIERWFQAWEPVFPALEDAR